MTNEINDKITEKISKIKYYQMTWDDGEDSDPREFEDDCFLHISRGKYRFTFFNGQEDGCLEEEDLKEYASKVDKILKDNKIKL